MTSEELALVLSIKESYLKKHWRQIIELNARKGIRLIKIGRGDDAVYGVFFPWFKDIIWNVDELDIIE